MSPIPKVSKQWNFHGSVLPTLPWWSNSHSEITQHGIYYWNMEYKLLLLLLLLEWAFAVLLGSWLWAREGPGQIQPLRLIALQNNPEEKLPALLIYLCPYSLPDPKIKWQSVAYVMLLSCWCWQWGSPDSLTLLIDVEQTHLLAKRALIAPNGDQSSQCFDNTLAWINRVLRYRFPILVD